MFVLRGFRALATVAGASSSTTTTTTAAAVASSSSSSSISSVVDLVAPVAGKDHKNRDHGGMRELRRKTWVWKPVAPSSLTEAVAQLKKATRAKFVESVDVAVNLNIDVKKSDQNMRGTIALPHSVGKDVRIVVFASGSKAEEAKKMGAVAVGGEDLVERIKGGFLDFDRCIATPDMMPSVGKVARILGPRGLMPNPKMGTVTNDIATVMQATSSGVPYKSDKGGTVHVRIGRIDADSAKLEDNAVAVVTALKNNKPKGVKEPFVTSVFLSTTMGPGVPIVLSSLAKRRRA